MIPFIRSPFNYDMSAASAESALVCLDASMAQQSSKEECDINTIVRRFGLTGTLPEGLRAPQYGDFTSVYDFQTALNAVRSASETFMAMPAEVRSRFGNDAQVFLQFVGDAENRDEARRLGLLVPEVAAEPPAEVSPAAP